jgi:hypothetical protein
MATTDNDTIPLPQKANNQSLGDLFGTRKLLMGRNIISGEVGQSVGRLVFYDVDEMREREALRNATMVGIRIKPWRELVFHTTLFAYYDKELPAKVPWVADYFYVLKWFNWRPRTFSYGYENFLDNRFDAPERFKENFLQGYYFVSWNHDLPAKWTNAIRLDATTRVNITYHARYFLRYRDEANEVFGAGLGGWGKAMLGASMRYTFWKRLYVEAAAFAYPDGAVTQVQWDPDYTYGFGYFDWRPFRFSLTYGNWVMNRFPWNQQETRPPYDIRDGDLRLTFNWSW